MFNNNPRSGGLFGVNNQNNQPVNPQSVNQQPMNPLQQQQPMNPVNQSNNQIANSNNNQANQPDTSSNQFLYLSQSFRSMETNGNPIFEPNEFKNLIIHQLDSQWTIVYFSLIKPNTSSLNEQILQQAYINDVQKEFFTIKLSFEQKIKQLEDNIFDKEGQKATLSDVQKKCYKQLIETQNTRLNDVLDIIKNNRTSEQIQDKNELIFDLRENLTTCQRQITDINEHFHQFFEKQTINRQLGKIGYGLYQQAQANFEIAKVQFAFSMKLLNEVKEDSRKSDQALIEEGEQLQKQMSLLENQWEKIQTLAEKKFNELLFRLLPKKSQSEEVQKQSEKQIQQQEQQQQQQEKEQEELFNNLKNDNFKNNNQVQYGDGAGTFNTWYQNSFYYGQSTDNQPIRVQCITTMHQYQNMSLTELRAQDYFNIEKGDEILKQQISQQVIVNQNRTINDNSNNNQNNQGFNNNNNNQQGFTNNNSNQQGFTSNNQNQQGFTGNSNNWGNNYNSGGGVFENRYSNFNNGGNRVFGNNNNQTGGLFGNTNNNNQTGGLFGSNNTNNPNRGKSIFRNNNNQSGGGLFGNNTVNNRGGGGLFSNINQNQGGGAFSNRNNVFNGQNNNTGSLFGGGNRGNNRNNNIFGNNQNNGGLFGNNNNNPQRQLFGNNNNNRGGLFGNNNNNRGGGLFNSNHRSNRYRQKGTFGYQSNQKHHKLFAGFGNNCNCSECQRSQNGGLFSGYINANKQRTQKSNLFGNKNTSNNNPNNNANNNNLFW